MKTRFENTPHHQNIIIKTKKKKTNKTTHSYIIYIKINLTYCIQSKMQQKRKHMKCIRYRQTDRLTHTQQRNNKKNKNKKTTKSIKAKKMKQKQNMLTI